MPRATCRCGHTMNVPADGPERIVCPKCSAKIRVRRSTPGAAPEFIRFHCPCGRRLKVKAEQSPKAGKCPDCGRTVPVPTQSSADPSKSHPEAPTEELSAADVAMLDRWSRRHEGAAALATDPNEPPQRSEAGLRVCPRCGRPVHLNAIVCGQCGSHVPRR